MIDMIKKNMVWVYVGIGALLFFGASNIIVPLILFALGVFILFKSADKFISEVPGLISKLGLPSVFAFIIGLALATSLPEVLVTSLSAFKKSTELAVGNIVGSNMLNLAILALAAFVGGGLAFKKDINTALIAGIIASGVLYFVLSMNLSAISVAMVLLTTLAIYLFWLYNNSPAPSGSVGTGNTENALIGFIGIAGSSYLIVYAAEQIGTALGWTQSVIGVVLLAFATNIPELTVLTVSFLKGQPAIGAGSAVGSNIINITLGLGLASLFTPLTFNPSMMTALLILIGFSVVAWFMHKSGKRLSRNEAIVMLIVYIGFIWWNFI